MSRDVKDKNILLLEYSLEKNAFVVEIPFKGLVKLKKRNVIKNVLVIEHHFAAVFFIFQYLLFLQVRVFISRFKNVFQKIILPL